MDYSVKLRPFLGSSANLVEKKKGTKNRPRVIDFTKSRGGEEITLIEVGEHGITVEYVRSGHKQLFTFNEIQFEEKKRSRTHILRKNKHHSH